MDYQQITCKLTGKSMRADRMYKVRNDDCIENVVSICYSCPYSDSKNTACLNCYGTIAQNATRQINEDTGRVKVETNNYRNVFLKVNDEFIKMMDADEFIEQIEIIANLNNSNWNHGQRISDHLRAYIAPKTWKTDCANCKKRCEKQGIKTACEKAYQYFLDNGIDVKNATSEQIEKITLPNDCICKEQAQQMCYV